MSFGIGAFPFGLFALPFHLGENRPMAGKYNVFSIYSLPACFIFSLKTIFMFQLHVAHRNLMRTNSCQNSSSESPVCS